MRQSAQPVESVAGSRPLEACVAIVTGGGGGIGRATCAALARRGAQVVAVDVDAERLGATVEDLERDAAGPRPLGLELDVSRDEDAQTMARETLVRFARIDVLVTAAGILRGPGGRPAAVADLSLAEWELVTRVNLRGVFLTNRAVLPAMLRQGRGDVVNISSTSGRTGLAYDAAYCASKFGVIALSEAVADEVRPHGVRVQVLLPAAVDTPLWNQNGPLPRPQEILPAERVAETIVMLVMLPDDTALVNPTLVPLRRRHRSPAARGAQS